MICNVDRETNGQQVRIANGLGYMGRGGDAEQLNRRGGEGAEWGGEWGGGLDQQKIQKKIEIAFKLHLCSASNPSHPTGNGQ